MEEFKYIDYNKHNTGIIDRPGVAGAVLQSASSFTESVSLFLLIFKISAASSFLVIKLAHR